jgi:flagellar hook-associated protein 2
MAIAGVDGLASNIKTGAIVDAMIEADRGATRMLEGKKTIFETRLKAIQSFNAKLLSAQLDLVPLKINSTFNARKATSSSEASLTVSASSSAVVGTTVIDITSIARAHQRASSAQASSTSEIGTGNIMVQLGNGVETTLAITAGNGSLDAVASKINSANLGVTATVINDGSTGTPYKLVLQSTQTGTANMIKIRGDGDFDDLFTSRSDNKADQTSDLGDGTLTIQVGNGTETVLNFAGAGNSSLDDIVSSINTASLGVTASIVTDGAEKRIELAPTVAGTGIAISGTAAMSGLFDPYANTISTAKDAIIKLGSGATALTITKSSNTITDVIGGVTLNLKGLATGLSVTVGSDATQAKDAVNKFITSLNAAITYYNENSSYNSETKSAGILLSEAGLRRNLSDISRAFDTADSLLPVSMNALSAIGVSIDKKTGTFSLDSAVFDAKLAADPAGVMNLFTSTATSSSSSVQFNALNEKTKVANPFTVNVTTAASQALVSNTGALAATTVITAANRTLSVTIKGVAYTATLATGSYTRTELAAQVAAAINGVAPSNAQVTASLDNAGTGLELRTVGYGSSNTIKVTGGTANADLFLSTNLSTGVNVAGTITVDGVTTAANGSGRLLMGAVGTDAEGLFLTVTATAPVAGITITARKGVAQNVSEKFYLMTNAEFGSMSTKSDELEQSIEDMGEAITRKETVLELRRERYLAKFRAMEKMIQNFNSQGSAIAAFANSLQKRS